MINVVLVYPQFALVFLIFFSMMYMFFSRVKSIRTGDVDIHYYKTFTGDKGPPEYVVRASRHFSNLFEVPVLFFAACLAGMVIPVIGVGFEFLAWAFVILRYLHSYIHLGPNKLRWRMRVFFLGNLMVFFMWIQILWTVATRV